jgi:protein tyrosine/serine phosphatase
MAVASRAFFVGGWRLSRWLLPLCALAGLAYLGVNQLTGNMHTVVADRLFRSATLAPETLRKVVREQGIHTVINLRGAHPDQAWWREERRIVAEAGATMVDLSWPVTRMLTAQEIAKFLALAKSVREPVLIHCKSGSDRTGLAVALYLAFRMGADEETAESQLSLAYGHFGLPLLPAWALDRTFEELEPFLGYFDT